MKKYRTIKHKIIDLICRISPKPKVINKKKVNELIAFSKNNYFQFNYFLKLKSGSQINHIRNQIVLFDILKNNIFKNKSKIKFAEYACMDGYLSWNLSTLFKNITAIDINKKNIEKIKLVNQIFNTSIKTINDDFSNVKKSFNIITLIGCSYMLEKPLTLINNIISNQLSRGSNNTLYVDFRYWSRTNFFPIYSQLKYESLHLQSEGKNMPVGLKYEIYQSNASIDFINQPEIYKHTIFYRECDILNFIKNIREVSKVKIIGRDIVNDQKKNVRSLVLKVSC